MGASRRGGIVHQRHRYPLHGLGDHVQRPKPDAGVDRPVRRHETTPGIPLGDVPTLQQLSRRQQPHSAPARPPGHRADLPPHLPQRQRNPMSADHLISGDLLLGHPLPPFDRGRHRHALFSETTRYLPQRGDMPDRIPTSIADTTDDPRHDAPVLGCCRVVIHEKVRTSQSVWDGSRGRAIPHQCTWPRSHRLGHDTSIACPKTFHAAGAWCIWTVRTNSDTETGDQKEHMPLTHRRRRQPPLAADRRVRCGGRIRGSGAT